ncbi:uncharacterized protein LOC128049565 [Budorcas taxicolor]|uniref:uncharacterized protein LOC128049565 n=1 Tax=Budorcas taxicolor TaxID=37181 RepID=UPI0022846CDD|nr:uncharacterized protein LOC128049565 [Budorcas taxicolor]
MAGEEGGSRGSADHPTVTGTSGKENVLPNRPARSQTMPSQDAPTARPWGGAPGVLQAAGESVWRPPACGCPACFPRPWPGTAAPGPAAADHSASPSCSHSQDDRRLVSESSRPCWQSSAGPCQEPQDGRGARGGTPSLAPILYKWTPEKELKSREALKQDTHTLLLHALLVCLLEGDMLAWRSRLGEVFPGAGSAPGCGGSPPWSQHSGRLPVSLETRGRARPPSAGSSRQDTHTPPGGLGRACLAVGRPNPGLSQHTINI